MNKNNVNIKRENATTWSYFVWLVFGGFLPIAIIFLVGTLLTATIIGVTMSTQTFRLANYYLAGADAILEPSYQADKVKNTIWIILIGWFLWLIHKFFAGVFYITYFGRNIARMWNRLAKLSLMPFGIEIVL